MRQSFVPIGRGSSEIIIIIIIIIIIKQENDYSDVRQL